MDQEGFYKKLAVSASEIKSRASLARHIDPLAYSLDFEAALKSDLALFQATFDYVASQLASLLQRKVLIRLEHNSLAMASLAFERSPNFKLSSKERDQVSRAFLIDAVRSALKMIVGGPKQNERIDLVLKRLGCTELQFEQTRPFLPWDDSSNLNELLDLNAGIRLKEGNNARKLHYLCQLSVYTSTPKAFDDYPVSAVVKANEFFSLNRMWSVKPTLWERKAFVTESGKLGTSKMTSDSIYRKDLGLLSDLHVRLAELIANSALSFVQENGRGLR